MLSLGLAFFDPIDLDPINLDLINFGLIGHLYLAERLEEDLLFSISLAGFSALDSR